MKHEQAISAATGIAKLIIAGGERLATLKISDLPLVAQLSVMIAAGKRDTKSLDPRIREILIFGSTARGREEVGDLDLFVFDNGFYSSALLPSLPDGDAYGPTSHVNLRRMLIEFFEMNPEKAPVAEALRLDTDVHPVPIAMLTDESVHEDVAARYYDERFFSKAFSRLLRFHPETGTFAPISLKRLKKIYRRSEKQLAA